MVVEGSSVQYGKTLIPYSIRRSQRRKTVAVTIDPSEGVVLTAPEDTSVRRLDSLVHKKAQWIVERLRTVGQVEPPLPPREFVSGESFLYLGRQYRLRVETRLEPEPAKLRGGWLVVQTDRKAGPGSVRDALVRWYLGHAARRLPERVALWHRKAGVPLPKVLVRDQKKRWGSCDAKGNLRFNWRIIQAPMRMVDYVVVHELCHLIEENHTPKFWSHVGKVLPDSDRRREDLRRMGGRLGW